MPGGGGLSTGGRAGGCSERLLGRVLLLLLLIMAVAGRGAWAEDPQEENKSPVVLMPRIGVGIEYGGLVVRRGDFSSAFKYDYLVDFLQIGPHLLYADIAGEFDWGTPGRSLQINRTRNSLVIAGYRYDLGNNFPGALGNYYIGAQYLPPLQQPLPGTGEAGPQPA